MGKQSGFTLIEIAIVLVIIGLLLGGILKGQELINQAKVKNVANDLNGVGAAVYAYQDRYKSLPGDDDGADPRWGAGTKEGDRNGILDTSAGGDETAFFWLHLRKAGLISGDATSDKPPFNAMNGLTTVHNGSSTAPGFLIAGFTGAVICTNTLPAKIAEPVDSQFDDGKPQTGSVRATATNSGAAGTDFATIGGANTYDEVREPFRICKQM